MSKRIKGITIELDGETTGLDKALKDVNKNSRDLQKELRDVERLLKFNPGNTELVAQKQKLLAKEVENTREKLNRLKDAQDEVTAAFERGDISEEQYRAFQREIIETESRLNHFEGQLDSTTSRLESFGTSMTETGNRMKAVGDKMTSVGKDLSMKVTAPIVALGTLATKSAVDFESAFAGVRKTVDATEEEFAVLEKGIRNMAKELPASAAEIAGVAEAAGQLGIKKENILEFTRTMIDLGEATNMTADEAATSFAQFANVVGMPQENFDRLGSSVVALGNTMATTEADIVSMAMRLSGTGAQVGLTEAQIMALSATMASVGINAEAGGSAMSTVMKKISNAVADGGADMENFAKAAGMSSTDFSQAWKNDPITALDAFIKGLSKSGESGENLNAILGDLGIKGVQETDTLLRLAGASDLLSEAVETSSTAWEENTALTEEAAQRYATTESQLKILRNKLIDLGITIGNIIIPMLLKVVKAIEPWIEKFAGLEESTQRNIVVIAGLAAAIGPVLVAVGTLISSIGTIAGVFGAASTAIAAAGGASVVFGGALTVLTGPIGLTIAAIAALVAGGVLLYKNWDKLIGDSVLLHAAIIGLTGPIGLIVGGIKLFQKATSDAVPEVERFGDSVSENTQKAVGGFMDLAEKADVALKEVVWSQKEMTTEMAANMKASQQEITNTLLAAISERQSEEIKSTKEQFAQLDTLSEEQKQKIIEKTNARFEEEAAIVEEGNARISEIYQNAAEGNRAITDAESNEVLAIRQNMTEQAVVIMSENEVEQKLILEKMKDNATTLSAQEAAEVVRNATKKKDDVIKEANDQFDETYKWAIRQRDELGTMSDEEAEAVITAAEKKRDDSVSAAEDMHKDVVKEAKNQAKEHINEVDWETGQILSKWEVFKNDTGNKFSDMRKSISEKWEGMKTDARDKTQQLITDASTKFLSMKKDVTDKVKEMYTNAKDNFENIRKSASEKFEAVKKLIVGPIETARDTVKTAIDKIKSFFTGLKLEIPAIKLPKLPSPKVTGSFELGPPPRVPKLSWNAAGGIFSRPTIFNTANAGLQGVGEAGAEAILPLTDSVLAGIGKGIVGAMGSFSTNQAVLQQPKVINIQPAPVYLDGRVIGEVVFDTVDSMQANNYSATAYMRGG